MKIRAREYKKGVNYNESLFCRKVSDLQELIDITKELIENRAVHQEYFVTDEIVLNNDEFKKFANDFYEDQEWISEDDGGIFDVKR